MRLDEPLDLTPEARAKLVVGRRADLELLLARGFDMLVDQGLSLAPFGFRSTLDAVEWSLERYANGTFDPAKLHCRSWRLFTQGRFWLSQKVGRRAYKRLSHEQRTSSKDTPPETASPEVRAPDESKVAHLAWQAGLVLTSLHRRVQAPGLIRDWLDGTETLRQHWLLPASDGPPPIPARHKVDRTRRRHDAMFRFQCVAHALVDAAHSPERDSVVEWLFSPAANIPPFRAESRPPEVRKFEHDARRREGLAELILIIADEVSRDTDDLWEAFRRAHAQLAVTATTIGLFNLDRPELELEEVVASLTRIEVAPPWEAAS